MFTRNERGWSLVAAGVLIIITGIYTVYSNALTDSVNSQQVNQGALLGGIALLSVISTGLIIFGLPAIQSAQPKTGQLGQTGLYLLAASYITNALPFALAAYSAVYIFPGQDASALSGSGPVAMLVTLLGILGLISLVLGVGYLITGWVTFKAGIFPAWVGWSLMVAHALQMIPLVSNYLSLIPGLLLIPALLDSAAWIGYGWHLAHMRPGKK